MIRITAAIIARMALTIMCVAYAPPASQGSTTNGPSLGKWEFTGKDNTGLVWTGVLDIQKLDPVRFDPKRYVSICSLEVESTDPSKGTRGVEAPCEWDAATRTLSFTTGFTVTHLYTAVLAPDGKSLTQGKWTETKDNGGTTVRTGTWSAKLPER